MPAVLRVRFSDGPFLGDVSDIVVRPGARWSAVLRATDGPGLQFGELRADDDGVSLTFRLQGYWRPANRSLVLRADLPRAVSPEELLEIGPAYRSDDLRQAGYRELDGIASAAEATTLWMTYSSGMGGLVRVAAQTLASMGDYSWAWTSPTLESPYWSLQSVPYESCPVSWLPGLQLAPRPIFTSLPPAAWPERLGLSSDLQGPASAVLPGGPAPETPPARRRVAKQI